MFESDKLLIDVPVLPLRGIVVFPKMMLHFDVSRKKTINAVNKAMSSNQLVFATAQKDASKSSVTVNDLYVTGVVSKVVQLVRQTDGSVRIVLEGLYRAKLKYIVEDDTYLVADVTGCSESGISNNLDELALVRSLKSAFEKYMEYNPKLPSDIMFKIGLSDSAAEISDYVAGNIMLDYRNKQQILETLNIKKRIEKLIYMLNDEVSILEIESDINERTKQNIDKSQRDMFLREEIRAIQEELGEDDSPQYESHQLRTQIKKLHLSDEVEQTLLKECSKLEKMPYGSQEAAVIRTYIDTCIELPWNKYTKESIDLKKARRSLDKKHYGLDKVKERIIESLAVRKLNPDSKGNIICLVGPPGVGKTSIAMSVADAVNRKAVRTSLGGVKDEAEIRGHRRTYIGSMPGRIISGIKKAGSSNPLMILDEIDKLSNDYKGDPTSAMLEVLDSEQNSAFVDHYLDIPFDLSKTMFITTANDISAVPEPLKDRMDVIEISSYTREEKFNIAKKHLVKKQLAEGGLTTGQFRITDAAIYSVIDNYTSEAGVRTLERTIAKIIRKSAVSFIVTGERIRIDSGDLERLLGPKKYLGNFRSTSDQVGVVNGLAWTSVGGEILPVEVAVMDGTGKLELTGSLGDVMQESAKTALTCIRSRAAEYGIDTDFYKTKDIHIHAPEGAVPKDGPSAGVTMATAICSALIDLPVRADIAMTGEITLRGSVLPIGGLREKSMAAYRYGIRTVIIPAKNVPDISELDPIVRANISFIPVDRIDKVLVTAFVRKPLIRQNILSSKHSDNPAVIKQ